MLYIKRFPDLQCLSNDAATLVVEKVQAAITEKGWCSVVLSGGTSPALLYEYLAAPPFCDALPWGRIYFFWGDERCVSPEDKESNYLTAYRALLSKVSIPSSNTHRIHGELVQAETAAHAYEQDIREFFQARKQALDLDMPEFDLLLLGLGADGHTASLFPGDKVLYENKRWVRHVQAPAGFHPKSRITLTLPVINNSVCIFFLVSGKGKAGVLKSIMEGEKDTEHLYPAARVSAQKELVWFIDDGTVTDKDDR